MAPLPCRIRDATPLLPSSEYSGEESFSVENSSARDFPAQASPAQYSSTQGFHGSDTCSLSDCRNPLECSSPDCCKDTDCIGSGGLESPYDFAGQNTSLDYDNLFDYDQRYPLIPLSCQWLLTGQPCAVSPKSLHALGDHVIHDHIEPQTQQICQWDHCNDIIGPQNLLDHFSHDHQLDNYVCLWQNCKAPGFSSSEALDEHIRLMHTKRIDCHWGGCEVAGNDPGALKTHVYQDHLNISTGQAQQYPGRLSYTSFSHNSNMNSRQQAPISPHASSQPGSSQRPPYTERSPYENSSHGSNTDSRNPIVVPIASSYTITGPQLQYCFPQPCIESSPNGDVDSQEETPNISFNSSEITSTASSQDQTEPSDVTKLHTCMWRTSDLQVPIYCRHEIFGTENELQDHVEAQHTNVKYMTALEEGDDWVCRWYGCPRGAKQPFRDRSSLNRHMFSHTGYYAHECRHCNKRFSAKSHLESHERIHRKVERFQCNTCEAKLGCKDQLAIHERTHTGEKPCRCPYCDFCCADPSNMSKHKQIHRSPIFICQTCDTGFCRAQALKRHIKSHHSGHKRSLESDPEIQDPKKQR